MPAAWPDHDDGDRFPGDHPDDPFGGSSGVREPRRPGPHGPMSGAGEEPMPMPEPELVAVLPDPRYLLT